MIQRLIILGSGGAAYDILDIVEALNANSPQWELVGFLDDSHAPGEKFHGYEILGAISQAKKFPGCKFILAIGSDKSYLQRRDLIARTKLAADDFATLIHPQASVSALAQIGRGVYISYNTSVSGAVTIEDHVLVGPGCQIGHDTRIGEYSVIAPGACISGHVTIAASCYIGARSVIRHRAKIGENALVGMGATVVRDVATGLTVVGNPARPLLRQTAEGQRSLPRVDVIVPCYKYAHYMKKCVQSVLTQDGVDVRVLILDDASPDNTAEIGRQLADGDARVEFRRHVVNQGHIPTFNAGLEWAGGEFLLLLSADDLLLPGALKRATDVFREHPQVTLVYGKAVVCDEPENSREAISCDSGRNLMDGRRFVEIACKDGHNHVPTPTAIVRTHLQKALGGYRRELLHTGDMEMWMRHAVHGQVVELAAHQAYYRQHGMNMSSQYRRLNELNQHWLAFDAIFKNYSSKISNPGQLLGPLSQMFARDAFYMANDAFDRNDLAECQRGLEMALAINPTISETTAFRRLELKKRFGPKLWAFAKAIMRPIARVQPVSL